MSAPSPTPSVTSAPLIGGSMFEESFNVEDGLFLDGCYWFRGSCRTLSESYGIDLPITAPTHPWLEAAVSSPVPSQLRCKARPSTKVTVSTLSTAVPTFLAQQIFSTLTWNFNENYRRRMIALKLSLVFKSFFSLVSSFRSNALVVPKRPIISLSMRCTSNWPMMTSRLTLVWFTAKTFLPKSSAKPFLTSSVIFQHNHCYRSECSESRGSNNNGYSNQIPIKIVLIKVN